MADKIFVEEMYRNVIPYFVYNGEIIDMKKYGKFRDDFPENHIVHMAKISLSEKTKAGKESYLYIHNTNHLIEEDLNSVVPKYPFDVNYVL